MIYGYTCCNEEEFVLLTDGVATKGRQINLVPLCTEERYKECKERGICSWGFAVRIDGVGKERFKRCCLKGISLQKIVLLRKVDKKVN